MPGKVKVASSLRMSMALASEAYCGVCLVKNNHCTALGHNNVQQLDPENICI